MLTAAPEKPKLALMELTASGGVEPSVATALGESIAVQVGQGGYFDVLSSKDVQTLLGFERQKQLLGCTEEGSCLAELAGAMGARFVMAGSVTRLGSAYQLTLQTLDSQKAQPLGRSVSIARDIDGLRRNLPYAIAEATATPAPPPPSRALPIALIASGGALLLGAGVAGLDGVSRERDLNTELALGKDSPAVLKPLSSYREAASFAATEKTVAAAALGLGAVLIGAGIYLFPADGPSGGLALLAGPGGVGFAGTF